MLKALMNMFRSPEEGATLANLATVLRDQNLWPAPFREVGWSYGRYGQCAVGLAAQLWPVAYQKCGGDVRPVETMMKMFGIARDQATTIFLYAGHWDAATPEEVANAIDKCLAREATDD